MALSHIHKYLCRIRWAKIFLNKINLHRSLLPHSLMRQMNERGEKNLLLFQVCSMSSGQFFFVVTDHPHQIYWACLWQVWILDLHFYSVRISEFRVCWKYTVLWSFLGDSCLLRVMNLCCRMIMIALIIISCNNYYLSVFICGFCKRLASTVVYSLTLEPLPDKP